MGARVVRCAGCARLHADTLDVCPFCGLAAPPPEERTEHLAARAFVSCPVCAFDVPTTTATCPRCKTPLERANAPVRCPACRRQHAKELGTCPFCGAAAASMADQPAAASSRPSSTRSGGAPADATAEPTPGAAPARSLRPAPGRSAPPGGVRRSAAIASGASPVEDDEPTLGDWAVLAAMVGGVLLPFLTCGIGFHASYMHPNLRGSSFDGVFVPIAGAVGALVGVPVSWLLLRGRESPGDSGSRLLAGAALTALIGFLGAVFTIGAGLLLHVQLAGPEVVVECTVLDAPARGGSRLLCHAPPGVDAAGSVPDDWLPDPVPGARYHVPLRNGWLGGWFLAREPERARHDR